MAERIQFRIRRGRVQTYFGPDDPAVAAGFASVGWGTLIAGFPNDSDAHEAFAQMYAAQSIEWNDPSNGSFQAFVR